MKKLLLGAVFVVAGITVLGCTSNEPKKVEEAVKKDGNEFKVDETGKVEFKTEIVYFKYDDSTLTDEGMARISALAEHMKKSPALKISIEGFCDSRGSVEYNLALGQSRSDAVQKYLETVGVEKGRMAAVSFGEEKPAVQGETEEAWSKNRRVEFRLN